jgi:hypothetical protein
MVPSFAGGWFVRDARLGPLLESADEGILRQFLGQTDVAYNPGRAQR